MDTIYKYPIAITDKQSILVPSQAKFLHVGLDPSEIPCLWYQVNPDNPKENITIYVVGTGGVIPLGARHLGTLVQGSFVWHIFTE